MNFQFALSKKKKKTTLKSNKPLFLFAINLDVVSFSNIFSSLISM